ncbi:MAG TPA: hypothetical protein DCP22_07585 [Ruminococcaceae bacterium]|nr:hypothetical protein [Oscillospiraceae bacterium]
MKKSPFGSNSGDTDRALLPAKPGGKGAAEGECSLPEAPAGRLLYDEIVLLPVKGRDAAGDGLREGAP